MGEPARRRARLARVSVAYVKHLFVTQDFLPDLGGMARRHVELVRRYPEPMSVSTVAAPDAARYDAVDKTLYLRPGIGGDFRCFISTATGYGTVGVRGGKPFLDVVHGTIPCKTIAYQANVGQG